MATIIYTLETRSDPGRAERLNKEHLALCRTAALLACDNQNAGPVIDALSFLIFCLD